MPKLRKTDAEKRMERLHGLAVMLRSACILEHGNVELAAEQIGLHPATLYRKFKEPESLTLGQLGIICQALPSEMKETIRKLMLP